MLLGYWKLLREKSRWTFLGLISLFVVGTVLEIVAISFVFPFLQSILSSRTEGQFGFSFLQNWDPLQIGLILLFTYVIKNIFWGWLINLQYQFAHQERINLSKRILNLYLCGPYQEILKRGVAHSSRVLTQDVVNAVDGVLIPLIFLFSEGILIVGILGFLFYLNVMAATAILLMAAVGLGSYNFFVARKLDRYGVENRDSGKDLFQTLTQSCLAIREIRVFGKQLEYLNTLTETLQSYGTTFRKFRTLGELPRLFLEVLSIALILSVCAVMYIQEDLRPVLVPMLSVFAMGCFRLLPSLNRFIISRSSIIYYFPSLTEVQNELAIEQTNTDLPMVASSESKIKLRDNIEISKLNFEYPGSHNPILRGINLKIQKGQWLGIVGESGVGKSTLADLILGLLRPTNGRILVDGVSISENLSDWRSQLAFVPQDVFVFRGSLRENVSLQFNHAPTTDDSKILKSLEIAHLGEFVKSLPEGLNTQIGGSFALSGGQRQRLGIARAAFKQAPFLLLDEPTANLDAETQANLMKDLKAVFSETTVIMITHNKEVLKWMDAVYEIERPRI